MKKKSTKDKIKAAFEGKPILSEHQKAILWFKNTIGFQRHLEKGN